MEVERKSLISYGDVQTNSEPRVMSKVNKNLCSEYYKKIWRYQRAVLCNEQESQFNLMSSDAS